MGHLVGGVGNALVEAVSPFDRRSLQLCRSGGSMVVGVDAVGGPPDGDVTDEGGTQRSALGRPWRLDCVADGVVSDVMGEGGDQLDALGQVVTPIRFARSLSGPVTTASPSP